MLINFNQDRSVFKNPLKKHAKMMINSNPIP
jgi:hypothetical protein